MLQEDEPEQAKPKEARPVLAETFKSGNLRSNQETFKAQEEQRSVSKPVPEASAMPLLRQWRHSCNCSR